MVHECANDCTFHEWGEWSTCTHTCGGEGRRTRTRDIDVPATNGGECDTTLNPLSQDEACGEAECTTDCQLGDWGPWSFCSATCEVGTMTRARIVLLNATNGGVECEDMNQE